MLTNEIEADIMQWRLERVERLRTSERSWLALAGLFWPNQGNNTFGSDPNCNFVLPSGAPKKAGVFRLQYDEVYLSAEPGVRITCNGGKPPNRPLLDDQKDQPDYLRLGRFIFVVIKRGKQTLVRLWDTEHPLRKEFSGLNFYPIKLDYRFDAVYRGYAPHKRVKQQDIIGEIHDTDMIGAVSFRWQGNEYHLDAEDAGDGLFIAFKDATNAQTTYAGGRYIQTKKPQDGKVTLDFNKAYNMPCAYTVYATCGLPTNNNRLPFAVEAGEMKYQRGH